MADFQTPSPVEKITENDMESGAPPVNSTGQDGWLPAPPSYSELPEGPPPSYASVFGKVKQIKTESSGSVDCCKKTLMLLCGSVACLVLTGVSVALPIAMIVIGALNSTTCPLAPMVPIYLIVGGAVSCGYMVVIFIRRIISSRKSGENNEEDALASHPAMKAFDGLINIFTFAWFIVGNYYVYSAWRTKTCAIYECGAAGYCDPTVLLFAFWLLNSVYILVGCSMCICCITGVCFCCTKK